jgi:hypothetical protein
MEAREASSARTCRIALVRKGASSNFFLAASLAAKACARSRESPAGTQQGVNSCSQLRKKQDVHSRWLSSVAASCAAESAASDDAADNPNDPNGSGDAAWSGAGAAAGGGERWGG